MRVIAGKYKGRRLQPPAWDGLRPTSDKLRETLFNILAPRLEGARGAVKNDEQEHAHGQEADGGGAPGGAGAAVVLSQKAACGVFAGRFKPAARRRRSVGGQHDHKCVCH